MGFGHILDIDSHPYSFISYDQSSFRTLAEVDEFSVFVCDMDTVLIFVTGLTAG